MDVAEIAKLLAQRTEEIAAYLLANGKRKGQEWCAGSVSGEKGESLKVHLTGSKAGIWKDFANGEGGDLIDLWVAVKNISLRQAINQAKDYLNIIEPQFVGQKQKTYKIPDKPNCKKPVESSPVFEYLTRERKLNTDTLKAYQIGESADNQGAIILFPFKRKENLFNIKYLRLERDQRGKKKSWFSKDCELGLFGSHLVSANSRQILITEGELDAMSWYQYGHVALSVPNGCKSHTWIDNEFEFLEQFDTIYLSFDQDEEGRKGVAQLVDRLGIHRCRVISLPCKDANECLQKGITGEEMDACFASATYCDPSELKRPTQYLDQVMEEFYPTDQTKLGYQSVWPKMNKYVSYRPGELSIWTGFNSHGKTTFLSQIALTAMFRGEKVCLVSLETRPSKNLKKITRQATGLACPSRQHIVKTQEYFDGKLWIYDWVGTGDTTRIIEVWDYARRRYGITTFVFDNLMRTGIAEDDYKGQKEFVNKLTEFATRHNVGVHLVAHSKKAENDHHSSGRLGVRGASAITDLAHNVFAIWKNQKKHHEVSRLLEEGKVVPEDLFCEADAAFICDKQREGDWVGTLSFWFDPDSQQYVEAMGMPPFIYVPEIEEEII